MINLSTELVHSNSDDIYTTSVKVAEYLEVPHKDLIRTIEKITKKYSADQHPTFGQKFIKTVTVNKQKRAYDTYDMNEPAFMKLVMNLGKYKKAEEIQYIFIQAFFKMRKMLVAHTNASWQQARLEGKTERLSETDKIKEFVEYAEAQGATHAKYYYANITKMTYRGLELLNHEKPIREMLSRFGLSFLGVAEDQVATALEEGMKDGLHYKEIFMLAKIRVEKLADMLPNKDKLMIT